MILHAKMPNQPHTREPTLAECLALFSRAFLEIVEEHRPEHFELLSCQQVHNPRTGIWEKLLTLWGHEGGDFEAWVEVEYEQSVKSLALCCYLARDMRLCAATGIYNINLASNLFERYSKDLSSQKHNFQFNINPLSGSCRIVSRLLVSDDQYKLQLTKPDFLCSVFCELNLILETAPSLHQLHLYFDGQLSQCPFQDTGGRKFNHATCIHPHVFLKAIEKSLSTVDPNCEESLEQFGTPETSMPFLHKHKKELPPSMEEVIDQLKGLTRREQVAEEMSVSQIVGKIYQASVMSDSITEPGALVKKIRILGEPHEISWEPFAQGGFGKIEKARIRYELVDFDNKNREEATGEIVRKSDFKSSNKIEHEQKILQLFRNEEHANIMQYFISEQTGFRKYVFSKFEPNLSLDKYMRANRKSLSLQTIARLMEHTLKGLMFLKEKHIAHLDIKPNNIIVTKELRAKLADFGEAYCFEEDPVKHVHGHTIPYAPSEIYYYEPYLNSKVDVYSFGVTMHKVLFQDHIWGEIPNKDNFVRRLIETQPPIVLAPEKLFSLGVPEILGVMVNLSIKCVDRDQDERPSLFYLSALLSLCRFYLYSLIDGSYQPVT